MITYKLIKNKQPMDSEIYFFENNKIIIYATLAMIWAHELTEENIEKTYSEEYAQEVIKKIEKHGIEHVRFLMTGNIKLMLPLEKKEVETMDISQNRLRAIQEENNE